MSRTAVLVAGPSVELCEAIRSMLTGTDVDVKLRVGPIAALDLESAVARPDVLVAALGPALEEGLAALSQIAQRPPTIVVGPTADARTLRHAMQAGARDYIGAPFAAADLQDAVQRIGRERPVLVEPSEPRLGRLFAVIDVKGGSGASFIAANLAHIVAVQRRCEVGLLDLDLQFGALPLAFDLEQRCTLLEALAASAQLDPTALRGYMARHPSGVHVLSAMSEQLVLPWEVSREALVRLLQVMRQTFPVVVVDLPRQIDPLTTAVLEQADRVLVVMQQSLAHARDAKRMQRVLTATLGIPRERVLVLINRHSEKQSVRESDVQDTVNPSSMISLPNDFATVSEALNLGVPVHEYGRDAPITRALVGLVDRLGFPAVDAAQRRRGLREVIASAMRA